jgi:hypothetical protein
MHFIHSLVRLDIGKVKKDRNGNEGLTPDFGDSLSGRPGEPVLKTITELEWRWKDRCQDPNKTSMHF